MAMLALPAAVPEVPDPVKAVFDKLTPGQQRYLAHLPTGQGTIPTCRLAGLSPKTVQLWRKVSPAFRQAEQAIRNTCDTYAITLSKSIVNATLPLATLRMCDRATSLPNSAKDAATIQRAGEVILKAGGMLGDALSIGEVERMDFVAVRAWMKPASDGKRPG